MYTLYHFPLCPFSRKLRVLLKEKKINFELVTENFWERREKFVALNPAVQVPIMVDSANHVLCDSQAIAEFFEEKYTDSNFIGNTPEERVEIRRLIFWFDNKFFQEVTKHILYEKIVRYFSKKGQPNSSAIRAGKANINGHLAYINFLVQHRKWLAGDVLSLADFVAASHLSVLDYLGDVPWRHYDDAKEWYALIKSRPSFRPLLADRIPGFSPASYYSNLDF